MCILDMRLGIAQLQGTMVKTSLCSCQTCMAVATAVAGTLDVSPTTLQLLTAQNSDMQCECCPLAKEQVANNERDLDNDSIHFPQKVLHRICALLSMTAIKLSLNHHLTQVPSDSP